ncbi:MAG: twin-arginine translocase TatA/TatE family subunit [Anaerolineaceae bacterium]|nr:twin-arginine translocase TatA/TatE family subunit [Anaerolineaceae bacterium]
MEVFGIGPLEFLLILVIAVIVLGPKGMVTAAREAGKLIRKIIRSPLWREVVDTSNEIRELPRKIVRDAGIEKDLEELRKSTYSAISDINRSQFPGISPVKTSNQKKSDLENSPKDEKKDSA